MKRIEIERNGICLAGDRLGAVPGVLLLHAGGERRTVWHPVMRELAASGLDSLAFDLRGHGESGGSPRDPIAEIAADIPPMLDLADRPVLVGASLGGFAALLALADAGLQARAAGLVLVDVVPDPDPQRTRAYLGGQGAGLADAPLVAEILDRAEDFRRAAAGLALPVRLVRGGRSRTVGAADIDRLVSLVPDLEVAEVARAGHLIAREAPQELSKQILDFMNGGPVRARRAGFRHSY